LNPPDYLFLVKSRIRCSLSLLCSASFLLASAIIPIYYYFACLNEDLQPESKVGSSQQQIEALLNLEAIDINREIPGLEGDLRDLYDELGTMMMQVRFSDSDLINDIMKRSRHGESLKSLVNSPGIEANLKEYLREIIDALKPAVWNRYTLAESR